MEPEENKLYERDLDSTGSRLYVSGELPTVISLNFGFFPQALLKRSIYLVKVQYDVVTVASVQVMCSWLQCIPADGQHGTTETTVTATPCMTKWVRSAPSWVTTQRTVETPYRRFGTTYRSHLQGLEYATGVTLEDEIYRSSRNVCKELPLHAV
jgi:hypothetical protein